MMDSPSMPTLETAMPRASLHRRAAYRFIQV
jgi:hypothetical protein